MRAFAALLLCLVSFGVWAHKASDSLLTLEVHGADIAMRWDIAVRDLEYAVGVDGNLDGVITWGELRAVAERVQSFALSALVISRDGSPCNPGAPGLLTDTHSDGAYAVLPVRFRCARSSGPLHIEYRLLFDLDPTHRGLAKVIDGTTQIALVFSPEHPQTTVELAGSDAASSLAQYSMLGVRHILGGADHLLFLLSLLLGVGAIRAVRQESLHVTFDSLRAMSVSFAKIVTAFTVAHSITLALGFFDVVHPASRWVETGIAASVMLAAVNNVVHVLPLRDWLIAFAFGLIHGLGFASALADLSLAAVFKIYALAGFNLGVELGQLVVVAAFVLLMYRVRQWQFYHRLVVTGSLVIALTGSVWFVERAFDFTLRL